jgi:predicted DNA-binding transcriptional regulator AlpA
MHKAAKEILKRLLTEQEAADYIGLSRSLLRQGRIYGHREGHIPPPPHLKLGERAIRYDIYDLDRWVEQFRSALGEAPHGWVESESKRCRHR